MSTLWPTGHAKSPSSPAYERIVSEAPMTPAQDATALAERLENFAEDLTKTAMNNRDTRRIKLLESAANALRSSASAGPQAEAVAWTNKAQLAFLRQPDWADIPMAMWAKESSSSPIPLYAHPQPQQADGRGAVIEALKLARDFIDPDRDPPRTTNREMVAKINAALSQSPATDGAGSSHTRPKLGGAAQ